MHGNDLSLALNNGSHPVLGLQITRVLVLGQPKSGGFLNAFERSVFSGVAVVRQLLGQFRKLSGLLGSASVCLRARPNDKTIAP